jgi:hypothetical protein
MLSILDSISTEKSSPFAVKSALENPTIHRSPLRTPNLLPSLIEARGWLYQALARAWCANRAALAPRQAGHGAWLDRSAPGAAADKRGAGRHGQ